MTEPPIIPVDNISGTSISLMVGLKDEIATAEDTKWATQEIATIKDI